jgi:hypothetical protein
MAEKFDEFSKHMAQKHSRRGAFKLFGAGIIGAAFAAVTATTASADKKKKIEKKPRWNGTYFNGTNGYYPQFNEHADELSDALDLIRKAFRKVNRD